MFYALERKNFSILSLDSAGNGTRLKLSFGVSTNFQRKLLKKLSGLIKNSSLFPSDPKNPGFDFDVKLEHSSGLYALQVSGLIMKKPGRFRKSITAFGKRRGKKDDNFFERANIAVLIFRR